MTTESAQPRVLQHSKRIPATVGASAPITDTVLLPSGFTGEPPAPKIIRGEIHICPGTMTIVPEASFFTPTGFF